MRANQDLRVQAQIAGVYLWQVAEALGLHDVTLSRKFRHELPEEEKQKIRQIITDLSKTTAL